MGGGRFFPDGLGIVVLDLFAGGGIEAGGHVAEPNFEEIGQFRHCADRGARGLDGVALLDGDRGSDVFDGIDLGLVEEVEELARVSAERLDVAPLALGVEGVEDEGGFTRATESRDGDVAAERDIEIEALEVVLAHAAQANALGFGGGGAGRRSDVLNHGRTRMEATAGNATRSARRGMSTDKTLSGGRRLA